MTEIRKQKSEELPSYIVSSLNLGISGNNFVSVLCHLYSVLWAFSEQGEERICG